MVETEIVDPFIGTMIGRYRVESKIGQGGMGAVYELLHPGIHKRVALKLLHAEYASREEIVQRFFDEARAVNLIGHPNIVDITDFSNLPDGRPFIIMEYLDGQSLEDYLDEQGPLQPARVNLILRQLCSALSAAHDKGIVHRDLKPENIFLTEMPDGTLRVKVLDFGIAKLRDSSSLSEDIATQAGVVLGTPTYMSPEQAGGNTQAADHRTDIYSLGVILYQMLAGTPPFVGKTFAELIIKHIQEPPPLLSDARSDISDNWTAIVKKALAKKQAARFQSMDALLAAACDAEAASEEFEVPPTAAIPPILWISGVAIVAVAVIAFFVLGKTGAESQKPEVAEAIVPPVIVAPMADASMADAIPVTAPVLDAATALPIDASPAVTDDSKKRGSGTLRITSDPWAQVFIDGKRVGQTPFQRKLPAGRHRIRLRNEDTGETKSQTVRIKKNTVQKISERWD